MSKGIHLILIFCFIYCLFNSLTASVEAKSVLHQIYAALYSLMAAVFFCTLCIIKALGRINGDEEAAEK